MNFDRSALPPAKSFYESEIGQLSRPDRGGWARGRGPFHSSKSGKFFSVHLLDGGWHCHGCGVGGGDVVAFIMKRDRVSFRRAAERLGAWKGAGLSEPEKHRIETEKRDREQKRMEREQAEEQNKRERIAARDHLHDLERWQDETSRELADRERRSPGVGDHAKDICFANLMLLCDQIRVADADYRRLAGIGGA